MKKIYLLLLVAFLLTGCAADQSDQKVPPGWQSIKTVDDAIVALPEGAYIARPIISQTSLFEGKIQKFYPVDAKLPTIDIAVVEVSWGDRIDLFRNGPKYGDYLEKYMKYFILAANDYLVLYSGKSIDSSSFKIERDGEMILWNDGAFKSTTMTGKGHITDIETKQVYRYSYYIWEKNGKPYLISFFAPEGQYDEDWVRTVGYSLYP